MGKIIRTELPACWSKRLEPRLRSIAARQSDAAGCRRRPRGAAPVIQPALGRGRRLPRSTLGGAPKRPVAGRLASMRAMTSSGVGPSARPWSRALTSTSSVIVTPGIAAASIARASASRQRRRKLSSAALAASGREHGSGSRPLDRRDVHRRPRRRRTASVAIDPRAAASKKFRSSRRLAAQPRSPARANAAGPALYDGRLGVGA